MSRNSSTLMAFSHLPQSTPLTPLALALRGALLCLAMSTTLPALAQAVPPTAASAQTKAFNIPAGKLDAALDRFARTGGVNLSYDADLLSDLTTQGLNGNYAVLTGLNTLLAGTGIEAIPQVGGGFALRKAAALSGSQEAVTLPAVTVIAAKESLPLPYSGGQVARGGRVGLFGNRDVMDTPFNVSNYTAELIENQQARSVLDVLMNDPSVVIGWPRDSYVDQFNVRGFNVLGEDFTYGGLFGISPPGKVPVEIVERVEILKGTSAFLRGIAPAASIGGSINLVPKRATDKPITRLTTTYDSTSNLGEHLDIGRRFGQDGEFGVRANVVYRDGDTLRRGSSKEMGTAAIGLDYRGDKVRLSFDAGYDSLKVKRGEYWYFLDSANFAIPGAPDNRQNNSQLWNQVKTNARYAMARAEIDLAPGTTAYITGGGQNTDLKAHLPEPIITNALGDFTEYFQYRTVQRQSRTAEAGVRSEFNIGDVAHALSFTATTLNQKSYGDRVFSGDVQSNLYAPVYVAEPNFFANPADAARLNNPPLQSKSEFSSVAIADEITLMDGRVQLMGGVRHQSVDVSNYFRGTKTAAYDKSAWTVGGGVLVKPLKNVSVYVNYMEGLNQGPVAPAGTSNAGTIFSPYKSKQYETGVKFDAGSFMATASLFQVAKPNGQTNPDTLEYSLDGEQRNRGLELGLSGEPVKGVRVIGGVMLLDAKLTSTQNGLNDGKRATGAPKYNIRIGGEWDVAEVPGMTLTSRLNHSASQYVDSSNLQSIPAWTTVDLGGRYSFALGIGQSLTLRADVRNLFDKAYWASSIGSWLNAGSGRTVTLSAMIDF